MKLKMRNKVTPEFTMAAMTDFVFQLLIIFMLISTLAKETDSHMLDINLPQASITGDDKSIDNVVIAVDTELNYTLNSKPVQKEQLPDELRKIMPSDKTKAPTIQLAIDEMAPHKVFVELVDILSVQNGWKIGVQTREPINEPK
jgi:biopolymer transport protein ExbD